jgi:hypothetical protein
LSGLRLLSATNRMLKKTASGVLASLRDSTYRSVRLASSLAAALLNGLFEHPEAIYVGIETVNVRFQPAKFCRCDYFVFLTKAL